MGNVTVDYTHQLEQIISYLNSTNATLPQLVEVAEVNTSLLGVLLALIVFVGLLILWRG